MLRLILISLLVFGTLSVDANPTGKSSKRSPAQARKAKVKKARVVGRQMVVLDYNSWFENIRVKGAGTPYETKALLYGTGLSYEYVSLRPKWGWGAQLGVIQGYAVAGDASDPTSYYAKRVPLSTLRIGGRYFSRVNPRFDLGVSSHVLFALKSWPTYNEMSVENPSGLMIGGFIDSRWRLDSRWELVQSVGTFSRGPSLAWRFGGSYAF